MQPLMGWTGQTHRLMWTGRKYRPIRAKMTSLGLTEDANAQSPGGSQRSRRNSLIQIRMVILQFCLANFTMENGSNGTDQSLNVHIS